MRGLAGSVGLASPATSALIAGELPDPRVFGADRYGVGTILEHRAAAVEEHSWLHDHARGRDVALHMGAGSQLDDAEGPNAPIDFSVNVGALHLDVRAHDSVLPDFEAFAVEHIPIEFAFDSQRAGHH